MGKFLQSNSVEFQILQNFTFPFDLYRGKSTKFCRKSAWTNFISGPTFLEETHKHALTHKSNWHCSAPTCWVWNLVPRQNFDVLYRQNFCSLVERFSSTRSNASAECWIWSTALLQHNYESALEQSMKLSALECSGALFL